MLAKNNRLRKRKDFDKLFTIGHAVYGQFLGVKYLANQQSFSRATVIVAKKTAKKAVQRNLLKRRLRQLLQIQWPGLTGVDLAIIALPGSEKLDYEQLNQEFISLLKRLKL